MSNEGFHFASKIVRGAYKDSERKRAKQLGYNDPIHDTYEDTCQAYNNVVEIILERVACSPTKVMIATHNEESIKLATQRYFESWLHFHYAVCNIVSTMLLVIYFIIMLVFLFVDRMAKLGIDKNNGQVSFAQIYGMCDHVSYMLGTTFKLYHYQNT